MAHIKKRKNKSGSISYEVRYGKPVKTKTFKRLKDAKDFLQNSAIIQNTTKTKIKTAAKRWIEVCEKYGRNGRPPVEGSTLRKYKEHAQIIIDLIGNDELSEYTPKSCLHFSQHLTEKYSRNYAAKIFTSFKGILSEAKNEEWIHTYPAENITIKKDARDHNEQMIPTLDEIQRILMLAKEKSESQNKTIQKAWRRFFTLFQVMAATGMRPGEVLGLPWSNVNYKSKTIKITQDLTEDLKIGKPKSRAGYRTIPIGNDTILTLKKWQLECPKGALDLVFPNWQGNPESFSNINRRAWKPLITEAGIQSQLPPKSLRHARASLEISLGANPKEIQSLMGHSSITVTFDIYGHLFPDHQDERNLRAQNIDSLLKK